MNKKMNDIGFFSRIKKSFWSAEFYAYIPKSVFWKGFFTLLGVSFIAAALIGFSYISKPLFANELKADKLNEFLVSIYPEELELTFENGLLTTNVEEPYELEIPVHVMDGIENLLVIDTETEFTVSLFDEYNTLAFANDKDLFIRQGENYDGEFIVVSFSTINNGEYSKIDRAFIENNINILLEKLMKIFPAVIAFAYLSFAVSIFSLSLFFAIFMAFIIWGVSANFHEFKRIGFAESYKLAMYGMIPALFVKIFFALTSYWTNFRGFPLMMSLLTLIVVFSNLQAAKGAKLIK